jgi:tetratricopeptide (TPR) repeat protein
MIQACHRAQHKPILSDPDCLAAFEYAPDSYSRELYEEEANVISEIQKNILAISRGEEPFDIFICCKEYAKDGSRTKDGLIAQDIYDRLTREGYRVFFSRATPEDKIGGAYEPYIFGALNSSKVMLVVGTAPEHFGAVWVKNEWSRYLALMKNDNRKSLIPCYQDMDAYDLPEALLLLRSQDMNKTGYMQDLILGVKKALEEPPQAAALVAAGAAVSSAEPLVRRAFIVLENEEWEKADELLERALDIDPENARAYIGKLMVELGVSREENLADQAESIADNENFQRALRFADAQQTVVYEGYEQVILARREFGFEEYREEIEHYAETLSASVVHTVGLKSDGTVVAVGSDENVQCYVGDWRNMMMYIDPERLEAISRDEERRRVEARRRRVEAKRIQGEAERRRVELEAELAKLHKEYVDLKGLLVGRRKSRIRQRIEQITTELSRLRIGNA